MRSFRIFLWIFFGCVCLGKTDGYKFTRHGNFFSLFEIVKFENFACEASNKSGERSGVCYTSAECEQKGGHAGGTCAQGFGVCCVFLLKCGETTRENRTYLLSDDGSVDADVNADSLGCVYTVCKSDDNVCRIRLDFATFEISGPVAGITGERDGGGAARTSFGTAGSVGDCATDSFSVSSPGGGSGAPVICGRNTGQHMILDASDSCHVAYFSLGGRGNNVRREWEIKVTQYGCGNEAGGPPGCLQYLTGNSGTNLASFNFPTSSSSVTSSTTHLSDQRYSICLRREEGKCAVCFAAANPDSNGPDDQASFGLSVSSTGYAALGVTDWECTSDYLQIPSAENGADFAVGKPKAGSQRICGRAFNVLATAETGLSICTQSLPFVLRFNSDRDEMTLGSTSAATDERDSHPGGIVGFNLSWRQIDCQK